MVYYSKLNHCGTSLAVWQLRPDASTSGGVDSISGGGTRIPYAAGCSQKHQVNHCNISSIRIKENHFNRYRKSIY